MDMPIVGEKSWVSKLRAVFWILMVVGVGVVILVLVRGDGLVIRSPGAYQAVFLDNGQVYFGKLESLNKDFLSLRDIYYLRAGIPVQQGSSQADPSLSGAQLDLIKLGSELHAPKDEMIINKGHVLFYEDLNESGEVMKLIRKHKAGK